MAATDTTNFRTAGTLSNPSPNGFVQPIGSSQGASTFLGSPSAISFLAPNQHDPYSERWNLGVQQRAKHGLTLTANYSLAPLFLCRENPLASGLLRKHLSSFALSLAALCDRRPGLPQECACGLVGQQQSHVQLSGVLRPVFRKV